MSEKIKILFLRIESTVQEVLLEKDTSIKEFKTKVRVEKYESIYVNGMAASDSIVLKNNDIVTIARPIEAAVEIKIFGSKWIIHKCDKDNKPSNFHAHDYEHNIKLDLLTGNIHHAKTNKFLKKMRIKRFQEFLKRLEALEL